MTEEMIDQSPTSAESSYRESNAIQLWSWNALQLLAVYGSFECISQVWNLQCRQTTNVFNTFIASRMKTADYHSGLWLYNHMTSECSIDQERPMPMPTVSAGKPGRKMLSAGEGGGVSGSHTLYPGLPDRTNCDS